MADSAARDLQRQLPSLLDDESYLGAGTVVRTVAGNTVVSLEDETEVEARMALAFPYDPVEGDDLLVIGRGDRHFVIGVLRTSGEINLRFNGDVRLEAERELRLQADGDIELTAKNIAIRVHKMKLVADTLVETARELYQTVRDNWRTQAGEREETTTGEWVSRSKKANLTTAEEVTINGREVRLG